MGAKIKNLPGEFHGQLFVAGAYEQFRGSCRRRDIQNVFLVRVYAQGHHVEICKDCACIRTDLKTGGIRGKMSRHIVKTGAIMRGIECSQELFFLVGFEKIDAGFGRERLHIRKCKAAVRLKRCIGGKAYKTVLTVNIRVAMLGSIENEGSDVFRRRSGIYLFALGIGKGILKAADGYAAILCEASTRPTHIDPGEKIAESRCDIDAPPVCQSGEIKRDGIRVRIAVLIKINHRGRGTDHYGIHILRRNLGGGNDKIRVGIGKHDAVGRG